MRSQIIPWTAVLLSKSSWRHRRHFWKAGRWSKRSKQLWFSSWNLPWPLQKPRHLNTYRRTCIHEFMHAYITCIHLYLYSQIYGCYISKTSIPFRKKNMIIRFASKSIPCSCRLRSTFLVSVALAPPRSAQLHRSASKSLAMLMPAAPRYGLTTCRSRGYQRGGFYIYTISTPIAGCFISWNRKSHGWYGLIWILLAIFEETETGKFNSKTSELRKNVNE